MYVHHCSIHIYLIYIAICTNIFIFLLKCNKQAIGTTIHCGYYVCYYLYANTKGKYLKNLIEKDPDVINIITLIYRL
jgi:hypothetical protein